MRHVFLLILTYALCACGSEHYPKLLQKPSTMNLAVESFKRVKRPYANLRGAHGPGAPFHHSILSGGDFTAAQMPRADFTYSDLSDADFRGANLRGATFVGAKLMGTNFDGADLRGARLQGTLRWGTSFRDVKCDAQTKGIPCEQN